MRTIPATTPATIGMMSGPVGQSANEKVKGEHTRTEYTQSSRDHKELAGILQN